jgi:HEAT repeat protein
VRAAADRHDEELSSAAIAALGRMGPEAIESLLSLGTTPARRDAVVRALIPNDDDALATIVDVLPAASDEAKELLILALGRVPGGRGAAPIAPCLSDSSLAVRRTAERALQQIDRLRAE